MGVCWPPAPVDCLALQRPGAATTARPMMIVLKKVVRYCVRLNDASSMQSPRGWLSLRDGFGYRNECEAF
jgi:hypothetical protein